ncbi:MAG: DNA primase [Bacilli bacterium]|nr:DNA primase [Bacilli bacterium]
MVFDHDLLQEIKSRADIVDVISSYINVIKKGRRYAAVCPFHDDHNPSMDINKEKQTYHCYVCHHGGDVFSFVADYEKISFADAVKRVCEIINFDDPRLHQHEVVKPVDVSIQTLYNCISELQKFYEYGLQTEEGTIARDYLKKRQLSDEQSSKFSLGYSLNDGKLAIAYLQKKGFSLKNIEDIGIALARTSGTADSNAGRLIFPIKDANGQVVAFSARKLTSGDDAPKYVNSPTTKIFKKEATLYNYHIAKQSAKHDGYLYVLEGFMDVFALDTIGISSAVAIMGTKLTEQHVNMIKRLNVEVRLCLDGDKPGQEAMMGIMATLDKAGISYRLVCKPGELRDPDEILKQDGEDKLKVYINTLVDPFTFAINYYQNYAPLGSMENRKKVIQHFAPVLANIKTKLEFDDYVYKLAEVTGFNVNAIKDYVEEVRKTKKDDVREDFEAFSSRYNYDRREFKETLTRLMKAERMILACMLNNKEAVEFYEKYIKYFTNDTHRQLANYLSEYCAKYNEPNASMIITMISSNDEENNKQSLIDLLTTIIDGESPSVEQEEEILKDCYKVIESEKAKTFEKTNVMKAIEGKDPKEQARLLNDYIKRTNDKRAK